MSSWWQSFFDEQYLALWADVNPPEQSEREADALVELLALEPGDRVLDAPCGYGRVAIPLARRGLRVVGVDYSEALIARAEADRGDLSADALTFLRADLRQPLPVGGFAAALNLFSSLGYGTEDDDLAILRTLHGALAPGGVLFLDTMHRDVVAARLARGVRPAKQLSDGTMLVETPRFDPIEGRMETTWRWNGPRRAGSRSASLRIYTITELVRLIERAGFRFERALAGISSESYRFEGEDAGGRLGLLARATGVTRSARAPGSVKP